MAGVRRPLRRLLARFSRRFAHYHPRRSGDWDSFSARRCCAMAERKPAKKATRRSATSTTAKGKRSKGFTDEERAAMKARAQELKDKTDGESAVRAAIAAMSPQDRAIAKRLHEQIKAAAPELTPKTWYGMPAYAKDGKVVCFFRNAGKFKERYAML